QRQDWGYDSEHHFLHSARAGRSDSFDRSWIDGLDRFGKQLREHSEIVNKNGHDAGEGAEADGHHEHQREDDLVDGPAGVHQPAGRLHDPLRAKLAALRIENGMPNATASAVPQIAICTVTTMSARYSSQS